MAIDSYKTKNFPMLIKNNVVLKKEYRYLNDKNSQMMYWHSLGFLKLKYLILVKKIISALIQEKYFSLP